MNRSKKIVFAILGFLITLCLCLVIMVFAFPDLMTSIIPDNEGIVAEENSPIVLSGTPIEELKEASNEGAPDLTIDSSTDSSTNPSESDVASSDASELLALAEGEISLLSENADSSAPETESTVSATDPSAESSAESSVKSETDSATASTKSSSEAATESSTAETLEAASDPKATDSKAADSKDSEPKAAAPNDRQAPVFLAFDASPQVEVGKEFDIHKFMGYADDVDRDVTMEVSGTVDTSKEGTYPVKITLTDDSGHSTSKSMDVKVVTKKSKSEGSRKSENFADFVNSYKNEGTMVGIDISRWQENVDFEKVKAAGCEFVYMRLGGLDDGELYTDRYYQQNIAGARAAGLKVGIYWHAEEGSPEEVKKSVEYLCNVLGGEPVDFPIAYDWEDFMNFERYGMNLKDINDCFTTFANEMQARGFSACLYGSKNYLENVWTNETNQYIWLAHYTANTSYAGEYFMWQHSCTGLIDGIGGNVDLDVLYTNKVNP